MIKLILSVLVACSIGCAGVDVKGNLLEVGKDCGSELVKRKLPQVLDLAKDILEGEAVDYKKQLDALKVDGVLLGFCAARKYVELHAAPVIVSGADGTVSRTSALTVTNLAKVTAVMRAVDYVGSK